jgi:hypothetical protein
MAHGAWSSWGDSVGDWKLTGGRSRARTDDRWKGATGFQGEVVQRRAIPDAAFMPRTNSIIFNGLTFSIG